MLSDRTLLYCGIVAITLCLPEERKKERRVLSVLKALSSHRAGESRHIVSSSFLCVVVVLFSPGRLFIEQIGWIFIGLGDRFVHSIRLIILLNRHIVSSSILSSFSGACRVISSEREPLCCFVIIPLLFSSSFIPHAPSKK